MDRKIICKIFDETIKKFESDLKTVNAYEFADQLNRLIDSIEAKKEKACDGVACFFGDGRVMINYKIVAFSSNFSKYIWKSEDKNFEFFLHAFTVNINAYIYKNKEASNG